jgi:pimeloyl-ACP methyl ester carboxylesterase
VPSYNFKTDVDSDQVAVKIITALQRIFPGYRINFDLDDCDKILRVESKMGCDRREQLKKLKIPVVVIHGDEDPIVNLAAGVELSRIIPNANLVIMREMAHDLPLQLVDRLSDAILMAVEN